MLPHPGVQVVAYIGKKAAVLWGSLRIPIAFLVLGQMLKIHSFNGLLQYKYQVLQKGGSRRDADT